MSYKKYELIDLTADDKDILIKKNSKISLKRIRYLRTIKNGEFFVKKGDLGGFLDSYANLSQEDNCLVLNNAIVCDDAAVSDDAIICENAIIKDLARIFHHALIYGNAKIYGKSIVYGTAQVSDNAEVGDESAIYANAK